MANTKKGCRGASADLRGWGVRSKETKEKHVFAKYCKQDKSEPVSLKLENKPKE